MKTNITTENYEAYLLDYMEGNLSHDEAEQLKTFVATQGLDWAELTEPLPYLEAPTVVYGDKEKLEPTSLSLSKGQPKENKHTIIPLYAKIASAAAAAGLLLTVTLWPDKSMPKTEPIAELKPIEAHLTLNETPMRLIPRRTVQLAACPSVKDSYEDEPQPLAPSPNADNKAELVATLSPLKAQPIASTDNPETYLSTNLALLRYRLEAQQAFAYQPDLFPYEEEMPSSFIEKGIYWMTEGRHRNLGDLINAGLLLAKKEVVKATTDAALTAYYRADEHLEDIKEYWQDKREE